MTELTRTDGVPPGEGFRSFWMGGFECATQRRKDGVRIDLISGTRHDRHALQDYRACHGFGLKTVRDGMRWHLIERIPRRYDWSSWLPMVEAAEEAGVQIFWDLFHYGWPSHIDPRSDAFVERFASYAAAASEVHLQAVGRPMRACLINEISFLTWAIEVGLIPPSVKDRPVGWMKRQLVKAAVAAERAMREISTGHVLSWAEPLIHVPPSDQRPEVVERAAAIHESQFEAYDMLLGIKEPELGGHPGMVHAMGLNYYPANQWYSDGGPIPMGNYDYRPLSDLLLACWRRYRLPLYIAETGAERGARSAWLHYVCDEVRTAMRAGVPVQGICLYPVTDYPGWDDNRHCETGLFGYAGPEGNRPVNEGLALELTRQQALFAEASEELTAAAAAEPAVADGVAHNAC